MQFVVLSQSLESEFSIQELRWSKILDELVASKSTGRPLYHSIPHVLLALCKHPISSVPPGKLIELLDASGHEPLLVEVQQRIVILVIADSSRTSLLFHLAETTRTGASFGCVLQRRIFKPCTII